LSERTKKRVSVMCRGGWEGGKHVESGVGGGGRKTSPWAPRSIDRRARGKKKKNGLNWGDLVGNHKKKKSSFSMGGETITKTANYPRQKKHSLRKG